jgi:quercetin dioxygenase-like cupin family protein
MNRPAERPEGAPILRRFAADGESAGWEGVARLAYKGDGELFHAITRHVLFDASEGLSCQLRYFDIESGGYSTLERHDHPHAVLILRGRGRVLVGGAVYAVEPFDLVHVPGATWHQFRADDTQPLGFLCLVDCVRDRPVRPDPDQLRSLRTDPVIDAFIRP